MYISKRVVLTYPGVMMLMALIGAGCSSAATERIAADKTVTTRSSISSPIVIEPSAPISQQAMAALALTEHTAQLNAASDVTLNLLVRLYLDDGNMVQFYEPAPGHLWFIAVTVGGEPLDVRAPGYKQLSAVALFQALAPNTAVPAVLTVAQQRADALSAIVQDGGGSDPPASSAASSSPGSGGPAAGTVATTATVVPLSCGTCQNWCDFSCWQCRECFSGDWFDWCDQNAYNGAYANNGGGSYGGAADFCSDQGTATLTITSDIFDGNYTAGSQQDAFAWSENNGNLCAGDDGLVGFCDQHIRFDVSGSNIHGHFGGHFDD